MADTPGNGSGSSGTNIESFGISVNTDADKATKELNAATTASFQMAKGLDNLGDSAKKAASSTAEHAKQTNNKTAALLRDTKATQDFNNVQQGVKATTDALTKAQQEFIDKTNKEAETIGKTHVELLKLEAAQLGVTKQTQGAIEKIESASEATKGFFGLTARATSELVVMGREIGRDAYSKLAGSLTVLAQASGIAFNEMTGLAGIVVYFGVELVKGAIELDKFQKSLILTNNFAGITRDRLNEIAEKLHNPVTGGVNKTEEVLSKLVATGKISSIALEDVARAVLNIAHLSGETTDEVIKQFEKMAEHPAKLARTMDESYNKISGKQYEHIDLLDREGKKQEALALAAKIWADAMDDTTRKVGYWTQRYRELVDVLSKLQHGIQELAKGPTDTDNLEVAQTRAETSKNKVLSILGKKPGGEINPEDIKNYQGSVVRGFRIQDLTKAYDDYLDKAMKVVEMQKKVEAGESNAEVSSDLSYARRLSKEGQDKLGQLVLGLRDSDREDKRLRKTAEFDRAAINANMGVIAEYLASKHLAYKDVFEKAIEKDNDEGVKTGLAGIARVNKGKNEIEAQFRFLKDNKEDINKFLAEHKDSAGPIISKDDVANGEKAIAEAFKDKKPENDGRMQVLRDKLNEQDSLMQRTKQAVSEGMKSLQESYNAGLIASDTYYAASNSLRDQELRQLQITTNAKVKLLESYKSRDKANQEDVNKIRNDAIRTYLEEKDKLDAAGPLLKQKLDNDDQNNLEKYLKGIQKIGDEDIKSLTTRIERQKQHNAEIGKSKTEIENARKATEDAKTSELEAQEKVVAALLEGNMTLEDGTQATVFLDNVSRQAYEHIHRNIIIEIGLRKQLAREFQIGAELQSKVDSDAALTKSLTEGLRIARDFQRGMKDAFGDIGKAIGDVVVALAAYQKKQNEIRSELKTSLSAANGDPNKIAAAQKKAAEESAEAQINQYGDMAQAAQGFFDKNSKGYEALRKTEQVFRAFELALALKTFIQKVFFSQAEATATANANTAKLTSDEIYAASDISLSGEVAEAKAGVAVTNQGGGDPYTAFVRIAAMAALMAGLGYAVKGSASSNVNLSASRQASVGTGTVAGDIPDENGIFSIQSQSIANATKLTADNSDITLTYTREMASYLKNINTSISALARSASQSPGLTYGNTTGLETGTLAVNRGDPLLKALGLGGDNATSELPVLGPIIEKLQSLWGKTTQEIKDSGLNVNESISNLIAGKGYTKYADVQKTQTSFFGLIKDTKNQRVESEAENDLTRQFGKVFKNIKDSLVSASKPLGYVPEEINGFISSINHTIKNLSLRGLKGDELTKALQAQISASADSIAQLTFKGFEDFQRNGEGYYETVIRVAVGVDKATNALQQLGVASVDYKNIADKQADVDTEIIRQSLLATEAVRTQSGISDGYTERLTGVGQILKDWAGSADDLVSTYKSLMQIRKQMGDVGLNTKNLSAEMVAGAGSVDALSSALGSYFDKFFSKEEQYATKMKDLTQDFNKLGITTIPKTRDEFRRLVQSIGTSDTASQKLTGKVLALASAFDDAQTASEELKKSVEDQQKAYYDAAATINKLARDLRTSNQSPLTPVQQYNDLKKQLSLSVSAAKSDPNKVQDFQDAITKFLDSSKLVNASGTQYQEDFALVMRDINEVGSNLLQTGNHLPDQITLAQQQLQKLNDINNSAIGVKDSVDQVHATQLATKSSTTGTILVDGSHALGLTRVPYDGYIAKLHKDERVLTAAEAKQYSQLTAQLTNATKQFSQPSGNKAPSQLVDYNRIKDPSAVNAVLIAEIKTLREEISELKAAVNDQTASVVSAQYDSTDRAANKVVVGHKEAVDKADWRNKVRANA